MYKKEDFSKCAFNPLEDESMLKANPKLATIIEMAWLRDNHIEKIIKYVIMVFDPKSPLTAISSLKERKIMAAGICGIDKISKDISVQILNNSYGDILPNLIIKYLINFPRSRDWAILCVIENKFWETIGLLLKPLEEVSDKKDLLKSSESKTKVLESLKTDQSDIDYYYKLIFGDDEEIEKLVKRTAISPQSIAGLKKDNV
jgi:hypothetical protein